MPEQKYFKEAKKRNKRKNKKRAYDYVSYTTGDINLNIDHFNKRMGSYEASGTGETEINNNTDSNGGLSSGGESLAEAKRYVRRYYIRPQNIFCSNKAEIIKTLIELDDANCSIYTLNNLGDEKDVSKLMNSDIIYYYDNGILYDKNKVKVMDYDLSIKKEENRKHLNNADKNLNKEFKDVYSDRMTAATELEEAFNLEFDSYTVYGEKLTEAKENFCCICGEPIEGYGNNPEPFMSAMDGQCCDGCNLKFVVPARLAMMKEE